MKKLILPILTLIILSLAIASCGGDSYEKRLKKETKAIDNFLDNNDIEILYDYPSDHKFKANQYYKEGSTGVYIRVISPGDTENALTKEDKIPVIVRFDSVLYMVSSPDKYTQGNNTQGGYPMTFTYGVNTTYIDHVSNDIHTYMMSPSLVLPLEKGLGSGAEVSVIVPFVNGSSYQMSNYEPYYFPYVKYTYFKQQGEKPKGGETAAE